MRALRAIPFVMVLATAATACSLIVDTSGLVSDRTGEGGGDATIDVDDATASSGDASSSLADGASPDGTMACSSGAPRVASVGSYCVDRTEVTNADYDKFLAAGFSDPNGVAAGCTFDPSFARKCAPLAKADDEPVTCVNWCDARAYCAWAGKRLCGRIGGGSQSLAEQKNPATDQWYNACSAGGSKKFPYGAAYQPGQCNDLARDAGQPVSVASSTACVGGFGGLFDMSGNVQEWVDSCNGSSGAADKCMIRGGAFDDGIELLACTLASPAARDTADSTIGFRCCSAP
jgi:sulfatase modifying factor 1